MSNLTLGTKLTPKARRQVLNLFVHRLTTENNYPYRNPCKARVPAITDAQWLKEHAFYTNKDGTLDFRYNHCEPYYLAEQPQESKTGQS